jgi:hypothetical protein
MKKTLSALLAVATVVVTLGSAATDANAQRFRRGGGAGVAAGIIGGLAAGAIIGGALAGRPAYGYPTYYAPVDGYAPYEGYYGRAPIGCPGGYWARRPIVNPYGQVVGYTRPRFFCP